MSSGLVDSDQAKAFGSPWEGRVSDIHGKRIGTFGLLDSFERDQWNMITRSPQFDENGGQFGFVFLIQGIDILDGLG